MAMTRDQMLAESRRVANYGLIPEGPVSTMPNPHAPAGLGEDVFSAADLLGCIYAPEEFTMPNGKRVWVHAISPDAFGWISIQVAKDIARDDAGNTEALQHHRVMVGMVWQTICACRIGPEPAAPQVFQPEHATAVRRNLSWETLRRICEVSDRVGGDSQALRGALQGFFGALQTSLEILLTRLDAGSTSTCRAGLELLVSCVSAARSRGSIEPADLHRMLSLSSSEGD